MDQPIDLIDIASYAFDVDNTTVATKLLEINESKSRSVPLTIKRDEYMDQALAAAVNSYDTSLMLFAFDEAKKQEKEDDGKLRQLRGLRTVHRRVQF